MRQHDERRERDKSPLSPVATGIALGIWMAAMLALALVIVPMLFAICTARPAP